MREYGDGVVGDGELLEVAQLIQSFDLLYLIVRQNYSDVRD